MVFRPGDCFVTSADSPGVRATGSSPTRVPLSSGTRGGSAAQPTTDLAVRPFTVAVPEADLADLQRRLERTRLPAAAPGDDWSYGTAWRIGTIAKYATNSTVTTQKSQCSSLALPCATRMTAYAINPAPIPLLIE